MIFKLDPVDIQLCSFMLVPFVDLMIFILAPADLVIFNELNTFSCRQVSLLVCARKKPPDRSQHNLLNHPYPAIYLPPPPPPPTCHRRPVI